MGKEDTIDNHWNDAWFAHFKFASCFELFDVTGWTLYSFHEKNMYCLWIRPEKLSRGTTFLPVSKACMDKFADVNCIKEIRRAPSKTYF